jgi:endonuclease G, mitochondrial
MKNKAIIGGLIALALLVLIGIACLWVGKMFFDRVKDTVDTNTNQPVNRPPGTINQPRNAAEAQAIYLAFGNPSNASASDPNNYLMINNYYALSYSRDRGIPNWAAWRVTKADMGNLERVDSFRPDDRLPNGWARVTPSDYVRSGYDKGHVVPNADRDSSVESQASTFLMTNMVPQTGDLNRGPWAKFEGYLRTLVTRGSDTYIVAGTYGEKGKLKNKVTIPTNTWKIVVALPAGSDISAANANTRVIAVDMPNVNGIKNADWETYRTTVRDIEQKTGNKFFTNLPQDLQNKLKSKVDATNN